MWWQTTEIRALAGLVLGAIVGSFLGAVLLRWPAGRSALAGRSHCDSCGKTLAAVELVPILSCLIQRGGCRSCGAPIDARHLAMEVGAAFIGLVAFAALPGVAGPVSAAFGWWLLLTASLDLERQWLPDSLTLPLYPLGLVVAVAGIGPQPIERLIGAAAGFLVLAVIALLYRRVRGRTGLGGGDPKLLGGLGAWLGWQQLPLVLLGAGLLGLASLLLRRSRGETVAATDRLPLGTLLAITAWPLWLVVAGQVFFSSL